MVKSLFNIFCLLTNATIIIQARSQDFSWGDGGCVPQEPGPKVNVWIMRCATSEDTRDRVSNLRIIKLKSGDF